MCSLSKLSLYDVPGEEGLLSSFLEARFCPALFSDLHHLYCPALPSTSCFCSEQRDAQPGKQAKGSEKEVNTAGQCQHLFISPEWKQTKSL